ncbi:AAA family ATPase [uncultured Zoogloea sp.]|uniref:AAA family ATPase n=1 Tax=uncultured Zoogloea sp. TaxID=160237 RepID=UPI0026187B32|nr:AAA family ATPase [uncultured Zoogloea sp.]
MPFYQSPEWRGLVTRIKRERGARCQRCGSGHRVIADHVIELRDGGAPLDASNIELLCQACHNAKTADARAARAGLGGRTGGGADGPMAHPSWFRPARVPLTVVCGPPGAGKSTWTRRHAGPADLVICMDTLARAHLGADRRVALSGGQVGDVLRLRNELLGDLMRPAARRRWPRAWLIASEPEARWRAWWRDVVGAERVVVLATPAEECKRRVAADAAAGDARSDAAPALIDRWWSSYAPGPGDTLVA